MSVLALTPDAYGSFARFSAVADFVELSALNLHRAIGEPVLARRLEQDEISLSTPLGPSETDPARGASVVFSTLAERARILGTRYPFTLTARDGLKVRRSGAAAYRVLLALTTAHAYRIGGRDPRAVFEVFVARALRRLGMRTATTGTSRRSRGGGFAAMLEDACAEVGLVASAGAAIISSSAQDEKVDMLGHLDLQDGRAGRWTFIGQATIASSEEWERKAREPKPKLWRRLITETHPPAVFLAVPHHVEDRHLQALHEREEAIVLDRLRLARQTLVPSAQEREVVNAVACCEVEW